MQTIAATFDHLFVFPRLSNLTPFIIARPLLSFPRAYNLPFKIVTYL